MYNRDHTKLRQRRQGEHPKSNGFNEQNSNSARASPFFCTFLCCPCTTMTWNDQIVSLLENGKGEAINFTISVWTQARSPLFTCNLNSLLLANRETWENLEKVYNDAKSIFQRRFHGRCRCRIARFLMKTEGVKFLLFTEKVRTIEIG